MKKMDKVGFSLLSLDDKLLLIKTQAGYLTNIRLLENKITLYSYNGYLIEEYRNSESKKLIKIEPIMNPNEKERLKLYSMY